MGLMFRQLRSVALVVFVVFGVACEKQGLVSEPYTPDSGSVAVRCGVLIDGISDAPLNDKTVVVVDGRFTSVVAGSDFSGKVLDLTNHTCLPGLIDTHTHIAEPAETGNLELFYTISDEENRQAGRANARTTLDAGFTSVRNLGTYLGWAARDLRDRIDQGQYAGPRMQVAGYYLTIPAGGGDLILPDVDESKAPARVRMGVSRGPDEFRRKAQEAVDGGADVLKVIASGAVLAFGGVPGAPEMTSEEIKAVVEVGHAGGIRVTAHAHGAQSIKDAINAGVDAIEHASLADDEAIALAAARQIPFSMDVYNGDYIATDGVEKGWPEEFIRKNNETTEAQRQVFAKAYKAGVPIIYGTDAGVYPHGGNAKQFVIMVQRGMTAMDAIKAATSVAADHLGWSADVGAVAPGRFGDLIAVKGDPLDDISVLQNVEVVIKGGLIFKHPE